MSRLQSLSDDLVWQYFATAAPAQHHQNRHLLQGAWSIRLVWQYFPTAAPVQHHQGRAPAAGMRGEYRCCASRAAGCCTWQLVAPPWHRMPEPAFMNTQFATRQWCALPEVHKICARHHQPAAAAALATADALSADRRQALNDSCAAAGCAAVQAPSSTTACIWACLVGLAKMLLLMMLRALSPHTCGQYQAVGRMSINLCG